MPIVFTSMIVSASSILVLLIVFYLEDRRGKRFLPRLRLQLDALIERIAIVWHQSALYVGAGALRVTAHYVFHTLLTLIVRFLETLASFVMSVQRRNRKVVRSVQAVRSESHLSAIEAHRQATALSEKERLALREKSLEG